MIPSSDFKYTGNELDLFAEAVNWKAYYKRLILPYLGKCVLEVGAGTGTTTKALCGGLQERWVCLEPDPGMAGRIEHAIESRELPACCEAVRAFTGQLTGYGLFDSVLYIDVLEHIEHDAEEANLAKKLLKPGGRLIVLSPAHQSLYSPFDKAIGHWRRYDKKSLQAVIPEGMGCESLRYVDSVGLAASSMNACLLRQGMPTARQLFVWDKFMIPASRCLDPLLGYRIGKSVLGVWRKEL